MSKTKTQSQSQPQPQSQSQSTGLALPAVEQSIRAKNPLSQVDVFKALHEYLEEALEKASGAKHVSVTYILSNVRLFLMFVACLCGLYAHFGCKYPRDNMYIAFFAIMYFVLSSIVQLADWFIVKSCVGVLLINGHRVLVDAESPGADNNVTFRLRSSLLSVESRKSVGAFFYQDGLLSKKAVWAEISDLHSQYVAQAKVAPPALHPKKD